MCGAGAVYQLNIVIVFCFFLVGFGSGETALRCTAESHPRNRENGRNASKQACRGGKKTTFIVILLRITLSPLRSIIHEENLQIK